MMRPSAGEPPSRAERNDSRAIWRIATGTAVLAAALFAVLVGGCIEPPPPSDLPIHGLQATPDRQDHVDRAMEILHNFDQVEPNEARRQMLYHLNQWIERQKQDSQWFGDPMINRLPKNVTEVGFAESLPVMKYQLYDSFFLQEAVLMKRVAQWVARQPQGDAELAAWLEAQSAVLGEAGAADLATAERLFDWTVRNIQLDPEPPQGPPAGPTLPAGPKKVGDPKETGDAPNKKDAAPPNEPPPLTAEPGTAYYPWQSLMFGHGDWLLRSRIFTLLARQRGIPVVMLGVGGPEETRTRPWLPAVVLGDRVYLFDMRLGLPIPGPQGKGIATLEDVRGDPQWLRALDLEGETRYPITADEVQNVVVLIDAEPNYLSQRMKLLEDVLSGPHRLALTVSPTAMARKLKTLPGIAEVHLWSVPYKTHLFQRKLEEHPQALAERQREEILFAGFTPLSEGRLQHLFGKFEASERQSGARQSYLACRLSDLYIDDLENSPEAQRALGVAAGLPQDRQARQAVLRRLEEVSRQLKQRASYWLGLIAFEDAYRDPSDYAVAVDYFKRWSLEAYPDGTWAAGARYNLARTYEALGETDKARELYLADDSPQRHGNLLRARRLASPSAGE
jgi:hypothetical protein